MFITVEEAKTYLRVDSSDEDDYIKHLINAAEKTIRDVTRQSLSVLRRNEALVRTAELYVVAYLYEHREEADHKQMMETVKYLLSAIRKEVF